MKSWVKAWLVAGVGCCVCGAILTGIGVASGGGKYVKAADLNKMDGAAKKGDNEVLLEKTKLDAFRFGRHFHDGYESAGGSFR